MKTLMSVCLIALLVPSPAVPQTAARNRGKLDWQPWSDKVFSDAVHDRRFVLLDLEAVWCHWCHVMDANTYSDPAVIKILQAHYIVVKADQDSRPDLSNRYEDFGWPATVVFDSDGHEIVKRQGYLAPDEMTSMLQAIIDDPSPGPSVQLEPKLEVPAGPFLDATLRLQLQKNYLEGYDSKNGSWGTDQKYLDWDSVEYSMVLARRNSDSHAAHMARQTLSEQLHLLDPAWGGVYQYSTDGGWNSPHFEKIMQMQAENLRIYSLAYSAWGNPEYLRTAQKISRYLKIFLTSPQGAFYTSQDADLVDGKHSAEYFALNDAARRKLGVPRVDKHIYTRENGWAINALVALYAATGDTKVLDDAEQATHWIVANRSIPVGGFRHGMQDAAGPYLGDNIAMARAFISLYAATADRAWLSNAESTMEFIGRNFKGDQPAGFITSRASIDRAYTPHPERDENVAVARAANLLFHYTGDHRYEQMSRRAMLYLAAKPVVYRLPASSVLLADLELSGEPLHLTIVGSKKDPVARNLFQEAMRYPSGYKRLEWWDPREGKLPNPGVQYPQLKVSAAFICTNRTCSPPVYKPADLRGRVDRLLKVQTESAVPGK